MKKIILEYPQNWEDTNGFIKFLIQSYENLTSRDNFKVIVYEGKHNIVFRIIDVYNSIQYDTKEFLDFLNQNKNKVKQFGYIIKRVYDSNPIYVDINFEEIISYEVKMLSNIYHITFDIFLPNIKSKGLVPRNMKKLGLNYPKRVYFLDKFGAYKPVAFFGKTWVYLAYQLYNSMPENLKSKIEKAFLLNVTIPKQKFYKDPDFARGYYCYGTVKPTSIKVQEKVFIEDDLIQMI